MSFFWRQIKPAWLLLIIFVCASVLSKLPASGQAFSVIYLLRRVGSRSFTPNSFSSRTASSRLINPNRNELTNLTTCKELGSSFSLVISRKCQGLLCLGIMTSSNYVLFAKGGQALNVLRQKVKSSLLLIGCSADCLNHSLSLPHRWLISVNW